MGRGEGIVGTVVSGMGGVGEVAYQAEQTRTSRSLRDRCCGRGRGGEAGEMVSEIVRPGGLDSAYSAVVLWRPAEPLDDVSGVR